MKRIVITGASSGLGNSIATEFAMMGWRVGVAARRVEPLEQLKERFPGLIEVAQIDITQPQAQEQLTRLIESLGGMDIFVQAAGVGKQNPGLDYEIEQRTLSTNCLGFATVIDTAFNYFSKHPATGGHIAAITSVAGTKGLGMAASYSASKRFESTYLTALEQLAHIKGMNVRFTDIRPGFIDTDLLNKENHYPMLMQPQYAVKRITRAIMKQRRVAVIDCRWWWVVQLWRMLPRAVWVRIKATTRKNRT